MLLDSGPVSSLCVQVSSQSGLFSTSALCGYTQMLADSHDATRPVLAAVLEAGKRGAGLFAWVLLLASLNRSRVLNSPGLTVSMGSRHGWFFQTGPAAVCRMVKSPRHCSCLKSLIPVIVQAACVSQMMTVYQSHVGSVSACAH